MLPIYVKRRLMYILPSLDIIVEATIPKGIIKMLVESLELSHLNYSLCVWGPFIEYRHIYAIL